MFGKKTFAAIVVVVLAYAWHLYQSKKVLSPIIETKLGKIQGVVSTSRGGKTFYEFLGIPYAQAPISNLRFEPPQPPIPWTGVRDASSYGSECAQLRLITGYYGGEEDCLTLNIFSPKDRKGLLPVMVFLHGGAFVTGSSNGYRGKYFMDTNIILVTLNYRLGALGFLNSGDGIVRGNQGLKDQTAALQFIKEHIERFGGDKNRVTLFGESAGSSSSSFHLVSKMSQGLFSSAIMQSGVFTSNWSVFRDPAKQAKRYASKFGCAQYNGTEMVNCLKNVDVKTFVKGHEEILAPLRDQITIFVPTIETVKDEHAFLTEEPIELLKAGKINKVNVLAGVNAAEGLLTSSIITANQSKLDQANNEYNFWASRILFYPEEKTDVSSKIRKFYFGDIPNIASKTLVQNYTNLLSDRQFFIPLHNFAREYKKHGRIRLYFYAHEGEFSFGRLLASTQKPYFPVIVNVLVDMFVRWFEEKILGWTIPHPGVCHADELALFYDWPLSAEITHTSKDFDLSEKLVNLWSSFAHNDNTNFELLRKTLKLKDVEWELVSPNDVTLKYLRIDDSPQMIKEPFENRVKFWENLGV